MSSLTIYDWATDSEDPSAFMVWDLWLSEEDFPTIDREVQVFEQDKHSETKMACTIVNGIRQRWHRFDVHFTDAKIIEIVKRCVDNCWYKIGYWRDTKIAMEALAKYFNRYYPEHPCYYARITVDDVMFAQILVQWHCMGFTYMWNQTRSTDRKDWILEWKKYSPITYGHRTCIIHKDWVMVDDSYSVKQYLIKYFKNLIIGQTIDWVPWMNIYGWFYVRVADQNAATENLKKYYKRKVRLEQNIANNKLMINSTTVQSFRLATEKENARLQVKLNRIMWEIKKAV
jgi:hypothetical protein